MAGNFYQDDVERSHTEALRPWNRNVVSPFSIRSRQPAGGFLFVESAYNRTGRACRQDNRRSGPGATSYGDDFVTHEVESDELGTIAFLKMTLGGIPYSRA